MTNAPLKFGTRSWGEGSDYEGVVRRGRAIVWGCGHHHRNRDTSTGVNGVSARDCVESRLRGMRVESVARDIRSSMRQGAVRAARLISVGGSDYDRHLKRAEEAIAAYDRHLTELAGVVGEEPVFGPGRSLIAPPAPVEPCPACGVEISPSVCARRDDVPRGFVWTWWQPVRTSIYTALPDCVNGSSHHPAPAVYDAPTLAL